MSINLTKLVTAICTADTGEREGKTVCIVGNNRSQSNYVKSIQTCRAGNTGNRISVDLIEKNVQDENGPWTLASTPHPLGKNGGVRSWMDFVTNHKHLGLSFGSESRNDHNEAVV